MPELSEIIVNDISKRKKAQRCLKRQLEQYLSTQTEIDNEIERMILCLKYDVYCDSLQEVKKIDELNKKYKKMNHQKKKIIISEIKLLGITHIFLIFPFGEVKMFGYCLANLLNYYRGINLSKNGIGYCPKKYKLVKRELKKRLSKYKCRFDIDKFKTPIDRSTTKKNKCLEKSGY